METVSLLVLVTVRQRISVLEPLGPFGAAFPVARPHQPGRRTSPPSVGSTPPRVVRTLLFVLAQIHRPVHTKPSPPRPFLYQEKGFVPDVPASCPTVDTASKVVEPFTANTYGSLSPVV